uniref:pectinesterase 1-like n=1 Tax=Erigeron canadensis TaxID=72917 RepID=UPI001CB95406|nr:pectinesterase 1-like [Erigeron canadensis]
MMHDDEEYTINFVAKPYHNVNSTSSSDDESPTPPKRSRTVAIIVILTLFTVIIGTILTSTVFNNHPNQENQSVKESTSIKAVCSVTKNPELCYTDISSVDPDNYIVPEMIFKLTLQLTLNSLANISSLPKILLSKTTTDLATRSAVRDCVVLFEDAVSQLVKCVEVMRVDPRAERKKGKRVGLLDEGKVKDMMTWVSGAMTDQETCVDGLEEMGSMYVEEVKMKIGRSSEMLSNCLAILNNMDNIFGKFGLTLH